MKIVPAEFGGTDVLLAPGDTLKDVPKSHQHLLSDEIRAVFADPLLHLADVIARCPFSAMRQWLEALHKAADWELVVHMPSYGDGTAGFDWRSQKVRGAIIQPSCGVLAFGHRPAELNTYYTLVNGVYWNGFGAAGGMSGSSSHLKLSLIYSKPVGDPIDPEQTFLWGSSPCGDCLVWTSDSKAGWYALGSHKVHLLGSVADTINWVFAELLAHRCPEWNYSEW